MPAARRVERRRESFSPEGTWLVASEARPPPGVCGIYLFAIADTQGSVGEVLYIGRARSREHNCLWKRLRAHLLGRGSPEIAQWLAAHGESESERLVYMFVSARWGMDPAQMEAERLQEFRAVHGRLPRWNSRAESVHPQSGAMRARLQLSQSQNRVAETAGLAVVAFLTGGISALTALSLGAS